MTTPHIIVIAGPTGVGKSETAVRVAEIVGGEIVNADSVQIYRHFDIGSGKPGPDFRKRVAHHLIDSLDPDQAFSLWDFKNAARSAIADINSRGKVPILAGGTGLYIKAALENLSGGAASEPELRNSLIQTLKTDGTEAMYQWLIRLNPQRAAEVHPNDTHRIIRGIENAILPAVKSDDDVTPCYNSLFFILCGPREKIYERIDNRVKIMMSRGWIDEVRKILGQGYEKECKPFQSVGYKQIIQFLENDIPMDRLVETIQMETRRYAKRQITWLNPAKDSIWIDTVSDRCDIEQIPFFIAERFDAAKG